MFGGVPIAESVVVTWVIMAVLLVLSLILVRNLKVENPGKKQLLLETGVSFLLNFFEGILGEEGKRYVDSNKFSLYVATTQPDARSTALTGHEAVELRVVLV